MNKAKLNQVFNLSNRDEVFSFMKDCAYRNQDLGEALIRHFLPDSVDLDSLRTEVRNIIFSVDGSEYRYGFAVGERQRVVGREKTVKRQIFMESPSIR